MARLRMWPGFFGSSEALPMSSCSYEIVCLSRFGLLIQVRPPKQDHLMLTLSMIVSFCRRSRKDVVKLHMRRQHKELCELEVITLSLSASTSRQSSTTGGLSPPPTQPTVVTPSVLYPELHPISLWSFQIPFLDPDSSFQSWTFHE